MQLPVVSETKINHPTTVSSDYLQPLHGHLGVLRAFYANASKLTPAFPCRPLSTGAKLTFQVQSDFLMDLGTKLVNRWHVYILWTSIFF